MDQDLGQWHEMHERMARLEEGASHRAETLKRLESAVACLDQKLDTTNARVDAVAQDVRDAKVGLRVGMWLWGLAVGVGGAAAAVIGYVKGVGK